MTNCILCPRKCGANRVSDDEMNRALHKEAKPGFCGQTDQVTLARAALHMWEEPCISGTRGSGAVFFCGCNLRCVFCQNADLANSKVGRSVSVERLSVIFLELQEQGAHNINLVTAGHFIEQIAKAIEDAKTQGLVIPIVYNTGTYEYADSIKKLDGLIDVYMPDLKYVDGALANKLSHAPDYFDRAREAIAEMYRQVGTVKFNLLHPTSDEEISYNQTSNDAIPYNETSCNAPSLMAKGVLVRHLVLPGHTQDSKRVLEYLYNTYGDSIYISIMNQYTPMPDIESRIPDMPELHRTLTPREYDKVINYALDLGITNAFIQEGETCKESFIPLWDYAGV